MTSLKNVYIYSGNNIFIFLAKGERTDTIIKTTVFIKYIFIKYKRNVKPMKKLEKSIAICLHVGMDIRIDWQTSKHFARNRPNAFARVKPYLQHTLPVERDKISV